MERDSIIGIIVIIVILVVVFMVIYDPTESMYPNKKYDFSIGGKLEEMRFAGKVELYKKKNYNSLSGTYQLSNPGRVYSDIFMFPPNSEVGKILTIYKSPAKLSGAPDGVGDFITFDNNPANNLSFRSDSIIPIQILINGIVNIRLSAFRVPDVEKFIRDNVIKSALIHDPGASDLVVEVRTFAAY